MSVGGLSIFNEPYRDILFDTICAEQGVQSGDKIECYTKDFAEKMNQRGDEVVAVILEPLVQGAGGMIVWPREAVEEVVAISRGKGAVVIFDEVMTGCLAALEKTLPSNIYPSCPDIICLSKGLTGGMLPLALTVAQEEIYQSFLTKDKRQMFLHGHSFSANPLACAAALAACTLMKEPSLKEKWQKIESINRARIAKYKNCDRVRDIRVCGTIAALELSAKREGYDSPLANAITAKALAEGVFLRPLGNVLYILPPYCTSKEELHQIWNVVDSCINASVF